MTLEHELVDYEVTGSRATSNNNISHVLVHRRIGMVYIIQFEKNTVLIRIAVSAKKKKLNKKR